MMGVTQLLLVGACCLLVKEALGLPTTMGGAASHAHHDAQNPQQQEPSDADKRSQEDIMFGNQQNKPAGMVDDLIVFPERKASSSSSSAHAAKEASGAKPDNNATHHQQTQEKAAGRTGADAAAPLSEDEVPEPSVAATADGEQPEQQAAGELLGTAAGAQAGKFDYYDYADDTGVSTAGAAGSDNDERAPGQPDNGGELDYSLYDYGDVGGMASGVFRRKRNLRNSLEELLRNRRLHRRALRLKRDANMDDLLFFLTQMAKQEPYPLFAEQEVPPVSRITLNPPEPESPLEQYLNELGAMNNEERARALVALAALADQEQLVPVPRTGRPTFEDEQPEALPDWFQVARRSHGTFYPQDYRYLVMPPTPQKRNVGADHWGRVLRQRRRQQRAQDQTDVNRLYALAGLMAQPDQEDLWREP